MGRMCAILLLIVGCAEELPQGRWRGEDPNRIPTGSVYEAVEGDKERVHVEYVGETDHIVDRVERWNRSGLSDYHILNYGRSGDSSVAFVIEDLGDHVLQEGPLGIVPLRDFRRIYRCVDGCVPGQEGL